MPDLLLIRHAKAAPFGVLPGDHGRPLSPKGQRQAARLGEILIAEGCVPDKVLVSTSQRTCETLQYMVLDPKPEVIEREDLYLATADEIERHVWEEIHDSECLAVIGHNPGMSVLAWEWLERGAGHDKKAAEQLGGNFKTSFAARFAWNEGHPVLKCLYDPRKGAA